MKVLLLFFVLVCFCGRSPVEPIPHSVITPPPPVPDSVTLHICYFNKKTGAEAPAIIAVADASGKLKRHIASIPLGTCDTLRFAKGEVAAVQFYFKIYNGYNTTEPLPTGESGDFLINEN